MHISFSGIEIRPSEIVPEFKSKFKLSDSVLVTAEFRFKFDNWLLDFFGAERPMMTVVNPFVPGGREILLMHPNTVEWLKDRIGAK